MLVHISKYLSTLKGLLEKRGVHLIVVATFLIFGTIPSVVSASVDYSLPGYLTNVTNPLFYCSNSSDSAHINKSFSVGTRPEFTDYQGVTNIAGGVGNNNACNGSFAINSGGVEGSWLPSVGGSVYITLYSDPSGVNPYGYIRFKRVSSTGNNFNDWAVGLPDIDLTRIVSITPAASSSVSTSTSPVLFSTQVYVNASDTPATITYNFNQSSSFGTTQCLSASCAIDNVGANTFSTTTSVSGYSTFNWYVATSSLGVNGANFVGRHTSHVVISRTVPFLWIFDQQETVTSSSTVWTYGFVNGVDQFSDRAIALGQSIMASSSVDLTVCNFISGNFDLGSCGYVLVVPSSAQLSSSATSFYNNVLTIWPLGYVTRFVKILALPSAVEPPALTYKFGSSSPAVLKTITSSDPITFQIYDHFDVLNSARADDGSNKNIWDIIMPWWTAVISLATLLYILSELLGFEIQADRTQDTFQDTTNGRKTVTKTTDTGASISWNGLSRSKRVINRNIK